MVKFFVGIAFAFAAVILLIAACAPAEPIPIPISTSTSTPILAPPQRTKVVSPPYYTPKPTQAPTESPFVERYSFMLLGGDYRAHRTGTEWGNKTDVMVLIVVDMTDPIRITAIQLPRNLYVPVEGMPDMWAFAVYRRAGPEGMRFYINSIFGQLLDGIFYVNMDSFVSIVDDIGPLCLNHCGGSNPTMAYGEEVLEFLRDNDNNWGYGTYDAEERVFQVLHGLVGATIDMVWDNPIEAGSFALEFWGDLVEIYPDTVQNVFRTFSLGWRIKQDPYLILNAVQLEEPIIIRGDTPLEVRGMIVAEDIILREWILEVLSE